MTTYREKPLRVELLTHTPDPLGVIYKVWHRTRDLPIQPEGTEARRAEEVDLFRRVVFEEFQFLEMTKFTWWIEGIPRAFFDQLTRHREPGWFTKSHRVYKVEGFAARGDYLTTPEIANDADRRAIYDECMREIDFAYSSLIGMGCSTEDARGVLPLHLKTDLAWTTTLRDLVRIFRQRTCHLFQQEYWAHLMVPMREILVSAVDSELAVIFQPPCMRDAVCISKVEAQGHVDNILKRGMMDELPCRLFSHFFADAKDDVKIRTLVTEGRVRWAASPDEVADGTR